MNLRCSFNWLVEDGVLEVSPLSKIPKPKALVEQVQPFTQNQIEALLKAARASASSKRMKPSCFSCTITGVWASELCNLSMGDLDLGSRHDSVVGKGNKRLLGHSD